MALVWICLGRDTSDDDQRMIALQVHRALVEAFGIAEGDLLQIIARGARESVLHHRRLAYVERSADLVLIQDTAEDTRSAAQKRDFYRAVVALLEVAPGIRAGDVVVHFLDVPRENWFFDPPTDAPGGEDTNVRC